MFPPSENSLETVLDGLAEALFFQRPHPAAQRKASVRWIAARQGMPGSYAGMFAPTAQDALGIRLFTGEAVRSRAGTGHLLGEEACRVLAALALNERTVQAALARAVQGMAARLDEFEQRGCIPGTYCCGTCTAGLWRNLANGLLPRADERLRSGLAQLRRQRLGDGTWNRYPFYYTSLALTEIGIERAGPELRHAGVRWRTLLPRLEKSGKPFASRRAEIGRRLLALSES
jgi:hypothetical protein